MSRTGIPHAQGATDEDERLGILTSGIAPIDETQRSDTMAAWLHGCRSHGSASSAMRRGVSWAVNEARAEATSADPSAERASEDAASQALCNTRRRRSALDGDKEQPATGAWDVQRIDQRDQQRGRAGDPATG